MMRKVKDWFSFIAPRIIATAMIAGLITRIVLLFNPVTVIGFTPWEWVKIFLLGAVNDLAFACLALIPAFFFYSLLNNFKYGRISGPVIWILLTVLTAYIILCNDITDEYGSAVPGIANGLMGFITILFTIRLFVPGVRDFFRRSTMFIVSYMYAFLLTANIVSEWTFWDEFGVRYNFIAVDYLVYTNEVIGNILESYNIPLLVGGAMAAGAVVYCLMTRGANLRERGIASFEKWCVNLVICGISAVCGGLWLHYSYTHHISENAFVTELQENGCWNFLEAYSSSELKYDEFYQTIPEDVALAKQRELCRMDDNGVQLIRNEEGPLKKNIVLITIESMSASFMGRYGSTDNITPTLDTIAAHSLTFDRLFAAGNRTVRGLEAVTLCIPPGAGESIVKRPDNGGYFSSAEVLQNNGYKTRYVYGGDSYFDNMKSFFGAYNYDITDRGSYAPEEITFGNIWGTCDEDSYKMALRLCDEDYAASQKFYTHIMTISNHRPYTYPEGRITYEGNPQSRRAAVKYTDFALGEFLAEASKKPWFKETVFVILADHCASSAGKTSIPVGKYHIPAMIYSPGFIEPQAVGKTCSQIDLMPTLFSLLGFSYDSKFYGQNILDPDFRQRAFMATYQNLGYYADGVLTVLSPVKRIEQFEVSVGEGPVFSEKELEERNEKVLLEAQSIYQISAR